METRYLGEDVKIKFSIDPVGDEKYVLDSEGVEWTAYLSCSPRKEVVIKRGDRQAIPMGDDEPGVFAIWLNTGDVGAGILKLKLEVKIPDGDFADDEKRTMIGFTKLMRIVSDYT